MNVVREINRINEKELDLAPGSGSWHDQYKDSAYIFVGGLNFELTEGDVVTVFSQWGEIADIDMPRDKSTGKRRGFAFLMYEDQRSTVLAVDNMNGAQLLGRTLRVDHVQNYKQKELVDGKWVDRETERLNVKPEVVYDDNKSEASEASESTANSLEKEDPMRDYLKEQKKHKSKKKKHADETPEERRARKERKRAKRLAKEERGHRTAITDRAHHSSRSERESRRSTSPPYHRSANRRERSPINLNRDSHRRRSRSSSYREERGSHSRADDQSRHYRD
ncbi:hypothetical protein CPB86DRAFT_782560 [Serendipita vermifera]|nr:hypothetical protein CPB86DRAFT_782560 [Serendipita vermifera]